MSRKVLLAEDHAIVIKGIKILFETEFKGYTLDVVKNSVDMIRSLKSNEYVMAIIDLQLEDGDTFRLVSDLPKIYPQMIIMVFSANPEELYAQRLYKSGIKGYLNKNADDEEIVRAITHTLNGHVYMSENFKSLIISNPFTKGKFNPLEKLSIRELEVANLLKIGKKTSDICNDLGMQSSTVATYKMKIFSKLNITNVIELKELFENYASDQG